MRRLFIFGFLAGLGCVLAAAHYFPWVQHERLPAQTAVVANGGRAETFIVRLPVDRIASLGVAGAGLRDDIMALPAALPAEAVALEHFKLRAADGNVIGVATRHWTETDAGPAVAWGLVIPGRGSFTVAAPGQAPELVETRLREQGYVAGSAWSGSLDIAAVAAGAATRTVAASDEFRDLQLSFTETWAVRGVNEAGQIRGTIVLDTIGRQGS
jgi:hypothetical protein